MAEEEFEANHAENHRKQYQEYLATTSKPGLSALRIVRSVGIDFRPYDED